MDWTKILWAGLLVAMLVYLWPRAKHMLKESPKGTASDWHGVLIPLLAVAGFVALLIASV